MFDVYICDKDTKIEDLPQEGTYYVITADGPFLHKDTDLIKGFVKVKALPFLGTIEPTVSVKLPKVPPEVILKAWLFFRRVFRRDRSEAELNLYFNRAKEDYLLVCRSQGGSFGGVHYGRKFDNETWQTTEQPEEIPEEDRETVAELHQLASQGYRKVGTVHSHCSFNAFHSGTDIGDEATKDGIHITIGHVDRDNFSLAVSIAVNDNRFSLLPESVILGIEPKSCADEAGNRVIGFREQASFFSLTIPLGDQQQIEEDFGPTLDEWLEMVNEQGGGWWPWSKKKKKKTGTTAPLGQEAGGPNDPRLADPVLQGEPPTEVVGAEEGLEEVRAIIGEPVPSEEVVTQENSVPVLALSVERDLRQVRNHASALKQNTGQIPEGRVKILTDTLRRFFDKEDITQEDINLATRINPHRRTYEAETT